MTLICSGHTWSYSFLLDVHDTLHNNVWTFIHVKTIPMLIFMIESHHFSQHIVISDHILNLDIIHVLYMCYTCISVNRQSWLPAVLNTQTHSRQMICVQRNRHVLIIRHLPMILPTIDGNTCTCVCVMSLCTWISIPILILLFIYSSIYTPYLNTLYGVIHVLLYTSFIMSYHNVLYKYTCFYNI